MSSKLASSLIHLTLFAAVCAIAAYWGVRILTPQPTAAPPPLAAPPPREPDPVLAARMFGQVQQAAARTVSNIQVAGLFAAGKDSSAVLVVDGKPPRVFVLGQEVTPGTRLVDVTGDHAVVESSGGRMELRAPPRPVAAGWRLLLEPGGSFVTDQVVLAAGAGCRALAPDLPERHRASWAGVLALPVRPTLSPPSTSPWWRHAVGRRIVQPRHWQRPGLERAAAGLAEERWIVDAGCAPRGEGLLLGQITLVRPGLDTGEPPEPVAMETRLRQGLAALDPPLAALPGPYRQVPVAFCTGGLPLVGPLPGAPGLWVFSGFGGAFAQVPVLAPLLADVIAGVADGSALAGLGVLPG